MAQAKFCNFSAQPLGIWFLRKQNVLELWVLAPLPVWSLQRERMLFRSWPTVEAKDSIFRSGNVVQAMLSTEVKKMWKISFLVFFALAGQVHGQLGQESRILNNGETSPRTWTTTPSHHHRPHNHHHHCYYYYPIFTIIIKTMTIIIRRRHQKPPPSSNEGRTNIRRFARSTGWS